MTDLLTPQEVADVFRVDPATVRSWARQGLIPSTRTPAGKGWRFRRDDVEQLLESGTSRQETP